MSATDYPTLPEWQEMVGTAFAVVDIGITLDLTEVDPHAGGSYSLLFDGPPGTILPQATYPLRREGNEPLPVFIVPIGADAEAVHYEAVFYPAPAE